MRQTPGTVSPVQGRPSGGIPEGKHPAYVCRLCRRVCGAVVSVNRCFVPGLVVVGPGELGGWGGARINAETTLCFATSSERGGRLATFLPRSSIVVQVCMWPGLGLDEPGSPVVLSACFATSTVVFGGCWKTMAWRPA